MTETYRLFAVTRDAKRVDNYLNDEADPGAAMPIDYFVWLAVVPNRAILIDTRFKPDVAGRRDRTHLDRRPMACDCLA